MIQITSRWSSSFDILTFIVQADKSIFPADHKIAIFVEYVATEWQIYNKSSYAYPWEISTHAQEVQYTLPDISIFFNCVVGLNKSIQF